MKSIYKFTLDLTERQTIEISAGAEILTAQVQRDSICIWALVDGHYPVVKRIIAIGGTGPLEANFSKYKYIATVQQGVYVWHIFDLGVEESR